MPMESSGTCDTVSQLSTITFKQVHIKGFVLEENPCLLSFGQERRMLKFVTLLALVSPILAQVRDIELRKGDFNIVAYSIFYLKKALNKLIRGISDMLTNVI